MNRALFGSSPYKLNLILDMLAGDFPTGVTIIDPDGSLAKFAANTVPTDLTQNVFYFDPSDYAHPAGFNIMAGVSTAEERDKLTQDIASTFAGMYADGWGHQSNFLLANCVRTALDTPDATMLSILKMLTDGEYRETCLEHTSNPVVLANWETIHSWDSKQYNAATAPLLNKVGTLLLSSLMQNILGQPGSTFSLTAGKIVIADLDRGRIGDHNAFLLGLLLIARATGPVYIHNLGFYNSEHLAALFARGSYTVTLQFLEELRPKLRQAVAGIENKYVFKTTREDAERLSFYVGVANPSMLMDLREDEYRTTTATNRTPSPTVRKRLAAIRRRSRRSNTRPKRAVEAQVRRFLSS